MKKRIIWWRVLLSILYLTIIILTGVYLGILQAILLVVAVEEIIEHWKIAIVIVSASIIGSLGGFTISLIVRYIFTGSLQPINDVYSITMLFGGIYTIGLIIEEDVRKPYICIYRKLKALFKKSVGKTLVV